MKVTLRQRHKGNKIAFYLDYYDKGKRRLEYLDVYLIPEPTDRKLNKEEKQFNNRNEEIAKNIRAKKHLEIANGEYGFLNSDKLKASFIQYVELLAEARKDSAGNYGNWDSALKYLKKFEPSDITFAKIDAVWLRGFKEYLQKKARTKRNEPLSQNSQYSYFGKIKAALKQARKDDIIKYNPSEQVDSIPQEETEIQFLTENEFRKLSQTPCEIYILGKAFIFSCLTGLRFSDVEKLTWNEVQEPEEDKTSKEMKYTIRFIQKKTKGAETHYISKSAFDLIGTRGKPNEKVFEGLKYSAWYNLKLQQWIMQAGISKTITFHCARHTYATLLITKGVDLYTVSKLLGHKNIRATQVYAKVIDEKRWDAANKITLEL